MRTRGLRWQRLQPTATCCNTLQHTATRYNTLQHATTHCNTLQHTVLYCTTLTTHAATYCNTMQHSTLQHTASHYNTRDLRQQLLQCVEVCCSVLRCVAVNCRERPVCPLSLRSVPKALNIRPAPGKS